MGHVQGVHVSDAAWQQAASMVTPSLQAHVSGGRHALLQSLAPAAGSPHVSHVDPALVQSEHASHWGIPLPLSPKSKLQKASPSHGLLTEHACCTRAVEEDPDERRARGVVEMGANQGSPHVAAAFVGMRQKSRETMMSGIVRIGGVCCFGRALAFFFLIVAITTLRTVSQL